MTYHNVADYEREAERLLHPGVFGYFAGGVRRGTDVVKALALGARAVFAGGAVVWGLAVGGEQGAREVLELRRAEIALGLTHLGCRSPAEVTGAHVRPK